MTVEEVEKPPQTQHIEQDEQTEEQPVSQGTMSAVTQATFGVTRAMMDVAKAAVTKAVAYTPGLPGRGTEEGASGSCGGLLTDDDKAAKTTVTSESDETCLEKFEKSHQENLILADFFT